MLPFGQLINATITNMTRAAITHLLTEFGPVTAFFIAAQFTSFFTATAILLGSTIITLGLSWCYERRVALMPLIASLFVIIPGYMTFQFKNEGFLIFGDSLFYFLMAAAVGSGLLINKLILKSIFEATFAMSDIGWKILSIRWVLILTLAGIGNELVRIYFTPEIWVNYKLVKIILLVLFGVWQFYLARQHRLPGISNAWGLRLKRFSNIHYSDQVSETTL